MKRWTIDHMSISALIVMIVVCGLTGNNHHQSLITNHWMWFLWLPEFALIVHYRQSVCLSQIVITMQRIRPKWNHQFRYNWLWAIQSITNWTTIGHDPCWWARWNASDKRQLNGARLTKSLIEQPHHQLGCWNGLFDRLHSIHCIHCIHCSVLSR